MNPFWHIRDDFLTSSPSQVLQRFWEDDDLNRQRSLSTFKDELTLVDEGLSLYIEAIQGAFRESEQWKENLQLRASIAMLIHCLNVFFAWRHSLMLGYLAEARLLARSTSESLSQALVFYTDKRFAERFFRGDEIRPKEIRDRLSKALTRDKTQATEILGLLRDRYNRLSAGAHPTLNSFSMRTIAMKPGDEGLSEAVPENVMMGGFLSDALGRVAWLSLARNVEDSLATVGHIVKEGTGAWHREYREYRNKVERVVRADNEPLTEL